MVHGCRQLVSWDVRLSPATSATLILSYYHLVEHSKETARVIGRKVGTKSNHHLPLTSGATHVLQWTVQREAKWWHGANLKKPFSVRIEVCNSTSWSRNRLVIVDQLRYGEYVLGSCTHRPSNHGSW